MNYFEKAQLRILIYFASTIIAYYFLKSRGFGDAVLILAVTLVAWEIMFGFIRYFDMRKKKNEITRNRR